MVGRHVSVGSKGKLSLSQVLSIIIKLKLSLFFLSNDNKIGLFHIVKYLFRVYHHINLNPGGTHPEDASAR